MSGLKPIWSVVVKWRKGREAKVGSEMYAYEAGQEECADELEALLRAHADWLQPETGYYKGWIVRRILGVPEKESSDGR